MKLFSGNVSIDETLQVGHRDSFSIFLDVDAVHDVITESASVNVTIRGCDSQSAQCPASIPLFGGLSFSTKQDQSCESPEVKDLPCFGLHNTIFTSSAEQQI